LKIYEEIIPALYRKIGGVVMKELRIIVCAKEIPDPEAPLSDVSVDAEKWR